MKAHPSIKIFSIQIKNNLTSLLQKQLLQLYSKYKKILKIKSIQINTNERYKQNILLHTH